MLDSVSWQEFSCADIFTIIYPTKTYHTRREMIFGGDVPFVGCSLLSNGVVDFLYEDNLVSGGVITVNRKTIANCFYHGYDFAASDQIIILTLSDGTVITKEIGLFLVSCLEHVFTMPSGENKYDFGYKMSHERLWNTKIFLPVNQDGKIDYRFMYDYMRSIFIVLNADIFVSLGSNR